MNRLLTILPFSYNNLRHAGSKYFVADDGGGRNSQYTLLDIDNHIIVKSNKIGMPATNYQYGLFNVRTNNGTKSGFIDSNGQLLIKDRYDMLWDFEPTAIQSFDP